MVSRIFSAINWLMAVTLVRKNMLLALGITQRGFIMYYTFLIMISLTKIGITITARQEFFET